MIQKPLIWVFADEPCLNASRKICYSVQDETDRGLRDGRDGIRFYPCTAWDGDVEGSIHVADTIYSEGYREGRKQWRVRFGSFPSSGDTRFDADILKELSEVESGC